jgi:hypothetical protein
MQLLKAILSAKYPAGYSYLKLNRKVVITMIIYVTSIFRTTPKDGKKAWNIIHTVNEKGETKVEFLSDEQMSQFELDPNEDVTILGPKPKMVPVKANYDQRGRLVGIYAAE